ncbi:uncharacterized protein MEPE_01100 [Melanopsichium pennsylvanicum]|uniref:Uncharacterized protein n=1 Tax=Melanopsichium pennsylvanicum TaxID=63383 RepID=A0AAJ5C3G0_9BASI|nr:uncharacterized protein MEPE_01100 [Melanopsichium pennsylvanicum]
MSVSGKLCTYEVCESTSMVDESTTIQTERSRSRMDGIIHSLVGWSDAKLTIGQETTRMSSTLSSNSDTSSVVTVRSSAH